SGLHEPVDALVGYHVPEGGQARAQASHARIAAGLFVHEPHDRDEGAVVFLPLGQLGAAPRVAAGPGHAELGAHERHRAGARISPARDGSGSHCLPFANQVGTLPANAACIRSSVIADLSSLDSPRRRTSSARSDSPSGASGDIPAAAAARATFSRVAGGISAPGSHGSEREPLGSLRSSHLTHSNVPVHFQCAKRPRSRATSPSHHFSTRLNEASRRYFLRAQRTR